MSATGRLQTDMSWHVDQVFDLADALDATLITTTISKLVVDVDRAPDDFSVGQDSATSTCPTLTLDGKKVYKYEEEPGPTEQEQRVLLFHQPFHRAIRSELDRLKMTHDDVVIFDCQSMRSRIKGFCDRGLPMISLGTGEGRSCGRDLKDLFAESFTGVTGFSIGVDDLFSGGYITRTYGAPRDGVHAMTVVVAQRAYLRHETPPFEPDKVRVTRLNATMTGAFTKVIAWAKAQAAGADGHVAGMGAEDEDLFAVEAS